MKKTAILVLMLMAYVSALAQSSGVKLAKQGGYRIAEFAFDERAKKAYAVVMTGESALYANIILKKGVVVS